MPADFCPELSFQSLPEQQAWQSKALIALIQYFEQYSPFYQRLFKEKNTPLQSIHSISDLQLLPTTSKADLQQHEADFRCVSKKEVREIMSTSGTMGRPVSIALTENDLQRLAYNESQSFICAEGKPCDVYQLMLTLDRQFMAGIAYYHGIRKMGATLIRTGAGMPQMQWENIFRHSTTILVTVPSFLLKMIDYALTKGIDLNNTPVQKAVCIGEAIKDETLNWNALGKKIKNQWNINLYSTYASTEMQTAFTECSAQKGGHLQPDLLIAEILDDAGNAVPTGNWGELTITTLGIEGMPLLRYRTGDICSFLETPCSCGRQSIRVSPVKGRKGQMIKLKGTTLYPPALIDALQTVPFVQSFLIEATLDEQGMDALTVHLVFSGKETDCKQQLTEILQTKIRVTPRLQFHTEASFNAIQPAAEGRKAIHFLDLRKNG